MYVCLLTKGQREIVVVYNVKINRNFLEAPVHFG